MLSGRVTLRIHRLPPSFTRPRTFRLSTMASLQSLEEELAMQNKKYNDLRLKPDTDPATLEQVWKKLGELKKTIGQARAAPGGGKDAEKKKERERLLLKTAKVRTQCEIGSFKYFQFMCS